MIGFIVKYMGQTYNVGFPDTGVSIFVNIVRGRFNFNVDGMRLSDSQSYKWVSVSRDIEEDINDEIEIEVADIDEPTEPVNDGNVKEQIESYKKEAEEQGPNLEWCLQEFYKIEAILKQEGLIE